MPAPAHRSHRRASSRPQLNLERLEPRLAPAFGIFAVGAGAGGDPVVSVFASDGTFLREVRAFEAEFQGGVVTALADFDGDGTPEIVAAAAGRGGPRVVVLDSETGTTLRTFFAFDPAFTGGVHLAVGDLNGDDVPDIVAAAAAGGAPHVKVFDGATGSVLASFFAFDPNSNVGANVATGDLDGDGLPEIVAGADAGGPHVRAFRPDGSATTLSFFAFDPSFLGGVSVAVGDVDGDGEDELFAGSGAGDTPLASVFRGSGGEALLTVQPYESGYAGGVSVAARDYDGDGAADLVTGASAAGPRVTVFAVPSGAVLANFFAFEPGRFSGVDVGGVNDSPQPPTDDVRPGVALATDAPDPTNGPFTVTATFHEDVTGFDLADVTVGNGTASTLTRMNARTWTFQITPRGQGLVTVDVPAGAARDAAGNASTAAAPLSRTFDATQPGLILATDAPDPTNGPFTVTATFHGDVTGFDADDVRVENGDVSSFRATNGRAWTFVVSPADQGPVIVEVAAGAARDAAGNPSAAARLRRTFDGVRPRLTLASGAPDIVDGPFQVTATFDEDVDGFDAGDVVVENGTVGAFARAGTRAWSFVVTPASDGAVTVDVAEGAARDAAGNGNPAATRLTRTFDGVRPAVTLTADAPEFTNAAFTVTATFSEGVEGFARGDVVVGNGVASDFTAVDAATYTFRVTPAGQGAVTIDVAGGAARDAGGNPNTAAVRLARVFDDVRPGVELSSAAPDDVNAAFTVTATFSEPVEGFDLADVDVGNGTAGGLSGDGAVYTFTVTPDAQGEVTVDVAVSAARDAAGNDNTAATRLTRAFDPVRPAVALSSGAPDPTNAAFTVTATFSEVVEGFDTEDVAVGNGAVSDFTQLDPLTWTFLVTPELQGAVTVDVAADAARDAAGNPNEPAARLGRTFDSERPGVVLSAAAPAEVTGAFEVLVTFTESVEGFEAGDVTVANGALTDFQPTGVGNTTWTFTVTPDAPGPVTVDVNADVAEDGAGNTNTAAARLSRTYKLPLPALGTLDGTDGQRFDGSPFLSDGDVSGIGDLNGDGFEDFAIGAPYASPNGSFSGSVDVLFGKAAGWVPSASLAPGLLNGTNGFRLNGASTYDAAGFAVSGAGDVNGDGFDDLLVNVRQAELNGSQSASVFVVFGKASSWAASSTLSAAFLNGSNGFRLDGQANGDSIGYAVAGAGDVNGDGFDDILLGTRIRSSQGPSTGGAYVVFGKASGWAASHVIDGSFSNGTAGFRLEGANAYDSTGFSVAGAGDVNGDGLDDFMVSAYALNGPANNSGAVYVVFGKTTAWAGSATLDGTFLNGTTGFRLVGRVSQEGLGFAVSGAGDVNGDGFDDLLIGTGGGLGSAYVVFGKASGWAASQVLDGSFLTGSTGFRLDGEFAADRAGFSVSGAGDVNGDGFDDILVSAYRMESNGTNSGSVYVVFGKASGWAATSTLNGPFLDGSSGFRLDGQAPGDRAGNPVSGAGDVNGDGFGDFLVVAVGADNGGADSGSAYLVFGGDFVKP